MKINKGKVGGRATQVVSKRNVGGTQVNVEGDNDRTSVNSYVHGRNSGYSKDHKFVTNTCNWIVMETVMTHEGIQEYKLFFI